MIYVVFYNSDEIFYVKQIQYYHKAVLSCIIVYDDLSQARK